MQVRYLESCDSCNGVDLNLNCFCITKTSELAGRKYLELFVVPLCLMMRGPTPSKNTRKENSTQYEGISLIDFVLFIVTLHCCTVLVSCVYVFGSFVQTAQHDPLLCWFNVQMAQNYDVIIGSLAMHIKMILIRVDSMAICLKMIISLFCWFNGI